MHKKKAIGCDASVLWKWVNQMSARLELSGGCVNFPLDLLRELAGRIPCLTDQGNSSEKAQRQKMPLTGEKHRILLFKEKARLFSADTFAVVLVHKQNYTTNNVKIQTVTGQIRIESIDSSLLQWPKLYLFFLIWSDWDWNVMWLSEHCSLSVKTNISDLIAFNDFKCACLYLK